MATKTRTITLTDRRPVTIREGEWPVLASARDDSWTDYTRPAPLRARLTSKVCSAYEVDVYHLVVRQHADGRALVYAVVDASPAWTGTESYRGGEFLAPGADVPAAIRRVGEAAHSIPESVIRECIADLPAEVL